jgi:DNA-binding phage protein
MNNLSIDLNDFLISNLRDKEVAREFLNASLDTYRQEGNLAEFLNSLELVSQAQQVRLTTPEIQLQPPVQFSTVVAMLSTLGLRLQIA